MVSNRVMKMAHAKYAKSMKKVAPATKKYVKKAIAGDKEKNYLLDTTAPTVTTAGGIRGISEQLTFNADDDPGSLSGRMGNNVSFETHLTVTGNTNVLNVLPTLFRFIIFKWNGTGAPSVADVLSSASPMASIFQDNQNDKSVHILYDKLFNIDPATNSAYYTSNSSQTVTIHRKCRNRFERNPTGGTVKGGIYHLGISDQGTYTPTATIDFKLVYTE